MAQNAFGDPAHGHYLLTREPGRHPFPDANWRTIGDWSLWVSPGLEVEQWPQGWLVGYALQPSGERVASAEAFDPARQDGRWVFIDLENQTVVGGAAHFLGICHHLNSGDVSSNPSLLSEDLDHELIQAVDSGPNAGYFPFGLTAHHQVRRVLPHHTLCLRTNTARRTVWPDQTPGDVSEALDAIIGGAKAMLANARRWGPLAVAFSGGTDSRILLAVMRSDPPDLLYTFRNSFRQGPLLDLILARKVAKLTGIRHQEIPAELDPPELEASYKQLTGQVVISTICRVSTMRSKVRGHVDISGVAAELYRSYFQYPEDQPDKQMTPEYLVKRVMLPEVPQLVQAAGAWLEELNLRELDPVLNLSYMEHRVGSWAAPQSHFWGEFPGVAPFVTHSAYQAMLRLPRDYRVQATAVRDICEREWPELLSVPINEIPASHRVSFFAQKAVHRVARKLFRL